MRFGWLVVLSYLGALTHPLLDMLTTYSVQLFSPFSKRWYHSDGLFIIDVWLWLLLASSIGFSKLRERNGKAWRRLPQAAIGIALAYIGLNLVITQRADAAVRQWAGDRRTDAIFASPQPLAFWRRDLVWREDGCYRRGHYDVLAGGFGAVGQCQPTNMENDLVREAISRDPKLQKFLKWSILPQADAIRDRCTARVTIGDARYGEGRRSRLARETTVPVAAAGCSKSLDKQTSAS
jgi:inner membrane protein